MASFWEVLDRLFPTEEKPYGSAVIKRVYRAENQPGMDVTVLMRKGDPCAYVPSGRFAPGERVEIVEQRALGPLEAMGLVGAQRDSWGFSRFFIQPCGSARKGENPQKIKQERFRIYGWE
ncbi:hypothetical protein HZB97_02590 [Candidatus Gottesmanbacteria bacterium]|nr:hypothetical protein [Candidatus Gottesmanbacteria bacterium]